MRDGEKLKTHNWIIEKVEMDGQNYVEVRNTGGEFLLMYREGTMMYAFLSSIEKDDETLESLAVLFGNTMAASSVLDAEFQHDLILATNKYIDRAEAYADKSEEESQRIIAEEKTAYEMKEEASGENGEESSNH